MVQTRRRRPESLDPIVGRRDELQTLSRFVEAAPAGGCALLIEGDAGIGKTVLWQEGVRAARERDMRVLAARCSQAETQIAFATIGDLFAPTLEGTLPRLASVQRRALETLSSAAVIPTRWKSGSPCGPHATSSPSSWRLAGSVSASSGSNRVMFQPRRLRARNRSWVQTRQRKPSSLGSKRQPRPHGSGPERASIGSGSRTATDESEFTGSVPRGKR